MTEERMFDLLDEANDIHREIGKVLDRYEELKTKMTSREFEELFNNKDDCSIELLEKINRIW